MNFIDRVKNAATVAGVVFANDGQLPPPSDDFWYGAVGGLTSAGVRVTPEKAMQMATVFACVRVISEAIASLSIGVYERQEGNRKQELPNHPAYALLKYTPNDFQSRYNFMQFYAASLLLRGNAYAEKIIGYDGQVESLRPLLPNRMTTKILPNNTVRYHYNELNGSKTIFLPGELFRVNGLSLDGFTGLSVIEHCRETFGGALQTQEYANRFFANDARPGGVLTSDKPMSEEVKKSNKEQWEKAHKGASNAHKVAILYGMTWQSIGMSNADAQFLETRKFSRSEICGLYGVPPHMIGDLDRATFSNIEHQDISFYKHTVRPHTINIEQSMNRDVILEDDVYAEFNMDAVLRGDTKTRGEFYSKALGSGGSPAWMTPNEVRAKENLNPIEGGDELPKPTNTAQGQMDSEPDANNDGDNSENDNKDNTKDE